MVGKYNKKGGSKASDNVMATNPKLCDDPVSPVNEGPKLDFNVDDLTLYKTTGGGKKKNLKKKSNKKNLKNKRNNNKKGKKSKKSKKSKYSKRQYNKQRGSGSSDWRSTLYSRGPVNNPNMDPQQFKMFSQHGQYIPNDSLRTASFLN